MRRLLRLLRAAGNNVNLGSIGSPQGPYGMEGETADATHAFRLGIARVGTGVAAGDALDASVLLSSSSDSSSDWESLRRLWVWSIVSITWEIYATF